jgi:hypothetical protein
MTTEKIKKNNQIILGFDVDGILRNWMKSFNYYYNFYRKKKGLSIIDLNYEPENFVLQECEEYDKDIIETVKHFNTFDICYRAEKYKDSDEFIKTIFNLDTNIPFQIRYITSQKTPEAKKGTCLWLLENDFLTYGSVIMVGWEEKWKYCDILIDDKIETVDLCMKNDVLGILLERTWNKNYSGYIYENYNQIITFLENVFNQ